MKSMFATAALLAASTAISGAATVTIDLTSDFFGTSTQYATLDTSLFNNASANVIAGSNLYPVRNYLVNRGTAGTLYYDNANDSSISSDGNKSNISVTETNGTALYIYNAGQGQTTVGYYNSFSAVEDLESVSAFTYSFSVSLTTASDNDVTFGLYYVESSSSAVVQVALYTALTDGETYTIDLLSTLGESVAKSLLSGNGYLAILGQGDDDGTWRGATLTTTVSATVTTTAVPEPSTFGLLAGVGALALVASRRRRSRKA